MLRAVLSASRSAGGTASRATTALRAYASAPSRVDELRAKLKDGAVPSLKDFQPAAHATDAADAAGGGLVDGAPFVDSHEVAGHGRKVFVETWGCQMNTADTQIVHAIMRGAGYAVASGVDDADVILLNTCAIRDRAEQKVWTRLEQLRAIKSRGGRAAREAGTQPVLGVLGCMASRLRRRLLEDARLVDLVAGPDAYRDLPRLLTRVAGGEQAINVAFLADETYADIAPLRTDDGGVSAFQRIQHGCANRCAFCVVPYVRGAERSRPVQTIVDEVRRLRDAGYKEVTLLGQNVNSYRDEREAVAVPDAAMMSPEGFSTIYKAKDRGLRFPHLMERVADAVPDMRVRFTSPHPKDFPDDLLHLIRERPNLCNQVHMPAQSGSTSVLARMRRGYTRDAYLALVERMRALVPGVALSTDMISGFCGETEAEHADTVSLMRTVGFDMAYMFAYSMREKTHAHRHLTDDVPEPVKLRRLQEVVDTFYAHVGARNQRYVGQPVTVLVEGTSRRSDAQWTGRTSCNRRVNFDAVPVRAGGESADPKAMVPLRVGDYARVRITEAGKMSLRGDAEARTNVAGE